ncbi:MAG: tetratricopeptide repeat protein [Bryobacteraceae bacterium]
MKYRPLLLCASAIIFAARAQNTADAWLSQAETYFEQQDWNKSEAAARAALKLNPRMAEALVILALIETNRSHLDEAEEHLRNAASLEPSEPRILSYLGSTYLREKRYPEAAAAFEKVLRLDAQNAVAIYNLGLISLAERKPSEALRYFRRAVDRNPSDVAARMGVLESELLLNDKAAVDESVRKLDSLIPAGDPERLRLAAMLTSYRDFQTALPIIEKLRAAHPKDYDLNYDLTLAYYRTGHYAEAEQTATNLIGVEPRAEAYDLLGAIEDKLQRYAQAMVSFERAATLDPKNENYRIDYASAVLQHATVQKGAALWNSACRDFPRSWRMHVGLGAALYLSGESDRAAGTLLAAVHLNPSASVIYRLLGTLYEAAPDKQAQIMQAFKSYLHLHPKDASAQSEYGRMLYLSSQNSGNQNFEPAKIALQKALAIDPHLAQANLELAIIAQAAGHFEESVPLLDRAVAASPAIAEAHYRLALAYRKLGDPDHAKSELDLFAKSKLASRDRSTRDALLQLIPEK